MYNRLQQTNPPPPPGRRYISEDSSRLLGMIEGLVEHEQLLVREYMNGILFSALNMRGVRHKALEMVSVEL